jgi:hypothetical protein
MYAGLIAGRHDRVGDLCIVAFAGHNTQRPDLRNAVAAALRSAVTRSKLGKPYSSSFFNNNAARTLGRIRGRTARIRLQMPKDRWIAEL